MESTPYAQMPLSVSTLSSLRAVYLRRLQRLQRLRRAHEQELNSQGVRLLNRSMFEAYCVCREIGAGDEALAILRGTEQLEAAG
jgi:hypothetical protein